MDANEKMTLKKHSKDIKANVMVTPDVLKKLPNGMLSQDEKRSVSRMKERLDKISKLVEILKKKKGGFQALTAALLAEKKNNEYYVNKMKKTLRDLNAKQQEAQHNQTKQGNEEHLERKNDLDYAEKVSKLVLGEKIQFNPETMNREEVINELEEIRNRLTTREFPLHKTLDAYRGKFKREKTDLTKKYEKKETDFQRCIKEQDEKIASLKEELMQHKEDQDKKISELVDRQVNDRLKRLNIPINDSDEENPNTDRSNGIQLNFGQVQRVNVQISE